MQQSLVPRSDAGYQLEYGRFTGRRQLHLGLDPWERFTNSHRHGAFGVGHGLHFRREFSRERAFRKGGAHQVRARADQVRPNAFKGLFKSSQSCSLEIVKSAGAAAARGAAANASLIKIDRRRAQAGRSTATTTAWSATTATRSAPSGASTATSASALNDQHLDDVSAKPVARCLKFAEFRRPSFR